MALSIGSKSGSSDHDDGCDVNTKSRVVTSDVLNMAIGLHTSVSTRTWLALDLVFSLPPIIRDKQPRPILSYDQMIQDADQSWSLWLYWEVWLANGVGQSLVAASKACVIDQMCHRSDVSSKACVNAGLFRWHIWSMTHALDDTSELYAYIQLQQPWLCWTWHLVYSWCLISIESTQPKVQLGSWCYSPNHQWPRLQVMISWVVLVIQVEAVGDWWMRRWTTWLLYLGCVSLAIGLLKSHHQWHWSHSSWCYSSIHQ